MKITKTLITLTVASAMMTQFTACKDVQRENPLLQESQVAFGAPDFSKIQVSD